MESDSINSDANKTAHKAERKNERKLGDDFTFSANNPTGIIKDSLSYAREEEPVNVQDRVKKKKNKENIDEENAEDFQDLGFGNRLGKTTKRLINRDGSFNVIKRGSGLKSMNPYVMLVNMPWWKFILITTTFYILINCIFALLYFLDGVNHLNGIPGRIHDFSQFLQAFYFSVQTFTTVGYGSVSPSGNIANFIAAFEALVGLLGFALATGLLYGRFSKPSAKVAFSEHAIIAPYKDLNSFQFRIVNRRKNQLIELSAEVVLMCYEIEDRVIQQNFYRLNLERNRVTLFPLTWTIVHPLDKSSPLYGKSLKDYEQLNTEFLIIIRGYDETFAQDVHTRYSYKVEDLIWGAKFKKVFYNDEDGNLVVEVDQIDETYPATLNPPISNSDGS